MEPNCVTDQQRHVIKNSLPDAALIDGIIDCGKPRAQSLYLKENKIIYGRKEMKVNSKVNLVSRFRKENLFHCYFLNGI